MVRKVKLLLAIVCVVCALGTTAHAASYTPYDGNPSNTYIQYFKDIVAGIPLTENYVAFRASQYEYIMVTGDLTYDGANIVLADSGTLYRIGTDGNYNSVYTYEVETTDSFQLSTNSRIIYSDVGNFPKLIERGAYYETLTAILLCVGLLGVVLNRFFCPR